MHEVHRPHLVDAILHSERRRLDKQQALLRLDPQFELRLYVDAVHKLVISFESHDVAQIHVTQAKASAAVVVGKTQQPVGHLGVLCVLRALVVIARLADDKRLTRHP